MGQRSIPARPPVARVPCRDPPVDGLFGLLPSLGATRRVTQDRVDAKADGLLADLVQGFVTFPENLGDIHNPLEGVKDCTTFLGIHGLHRDFQRAIGDAPLGADFVHFSHVNLH